ncbi:histidine-tRNA ligase, partial [Aeropyrum pernix]
VNDRRLLAGVFEEELGFDNPLPIYRAIDKLDKIGVEGVRRELERLGLSGSIVERIMEIISWRGRPGEVLESVRRGYGSNEKVREALDHLEEMLSLADDKRVELDMSLVRGLDYYTGPILEVVLDEPRIGSVAGGGRYDGLVGMFVGREIPATGVSIGIERIIDAGLELGVYSLDVKTVAQVAVVVLDRRYYRYAWAAARLLRRGGLNVRIDLSRASGQVQRRKASRLGIPVLAFVGAKEAEGGFLTLYSAAKGERVAVPL